MRMYTPSKWIIVGKDSNYRVFATWYEGYLDGDSWKLSSGVKKVVDHKDHYLIENHSGSVYKCNKEGEGLSGYGSCIYEQFESKLPIISIEVILNLEK